MSSLNQIIKKIQDYGNQHPQIKYVYFGEFFDKLEDTDVTYPALFIDLGNANISAKQITYNIEMYFMDRHLVEADALEVLSDQTRIAEDIVALIRDNANEWIVNEAISVEYFRESSPDYLAGCKLTVLLTLPSINNRCQIP